MALGRHVSNPPIPVHLTQHCLSENLPRPSFRKPPLKSLRLSSLLSEAVFQDLPVPVLLVRYYLSKTLLPRPSFRSLSRISISQPISYISKSPSSISLHPPSPNLPHPKSSTPQIFHTPNHTTTTNHKCLLESPSPCSLSPQSSGT